MTEDRFCGTCARYQNGVACKMVEPINDPNEKTFGCKNWTDKPEDIESNPVARGPIITDCLPGSPSVCVNCARYNPADGYCKLRSVRVYPAESTTCMNWLHEQYRSQSEENPDILLEICKAQHAKMNSQKIVSSTTLKALKNSTNWNIRQETMSPDKKQEDTYRMYFNRGRTIEQLDTVFDIACHLYPECADRWRATQTAVKDTMAAYTEMMKQQQEAQP